MKRLTCEMCGGTDLIKENGVFVCQSCGCKYSLEEAKKMMVEGVVEVTGTVSIDTKRAIEHNLELARTADESENFAQAETYADKIIGMDSSNLEAWRIKGHSANYQSTYGNDRLLETLKCYSKVIEGVSNNISDATPDELIMIDAIRKDLIKSCVVRSKIHGKVIINSPDDDATKRVTTSLDNILTAVSLTIDTIGKTFANGKEAFADSFERSGKSRSRGELLWKNVCSVEASQGEIYYGCGLEIQEACVKSRNKVFKDYSENQVFDYYGDPRSYDFDAESRWLLSVRDSFYNLSKIFIKCSDWLRKPVCATHVNDLLDSTEAAFKLIGAKVPNLPSGEEQAAIALENAIACLNDNINCRTHRRYHNSMSSGGSLSGDGAVAGESAIKAVKDLISALKKDRDDVKAMAHKHKQQRLREAEKKHEEAVKNYWNEHPVDKTELDEQLDVANKELEDTDASISEVKSKISAIKASLEAELPSRDVYTDLLVRVSNLEKERASLGLLKRKEKKQLDELIANGRLELHEIEAQIDSETHAIKNRAEAELKPYKEQLSKLESKRSAINARRTSVMAKLKAIASN